MDPDKYPKEGTNICNVIFDLHLINAKLCDVTSRYGISYCYIKSAIKYLQTTQYSHEKLNLPNIIEYKYHH